MEGRGERDTRGEPPLVGGRDSASPPAQNCVEKRFALYEEKIPNRNLAIVIGGNGCGMTSGRSYL